MHFTLLRINFLLVGFLISTILYGQAPISRLYGTYKTESGKTGLILQDSSIYALGTSSAFPELSSQVYLVKIDKNGDLLWSKFYGGAGVDDAVDMYVDLAVDTSIYIVSNSFVSFNKGYDVKIIKTDKNGNLIWEKTYGTTDWDIPAKMIKTSTNMLAVCGKTYGNSFGSTDGMFMLLNMNGDSLLFKNYGDVQENMFHDLIERSSDTIVFCGETVTTLGKQRAWLLELNIETGSYKSTFYGTAYNRSFASIENFVNGNYLIGVNTDSTGTDLKDVYIEVLNKNTLALELVIPVVKPLDEMVVEVKFFDNLIQMVGVTKSFGWGGWDAVIYIYDAGGAYVFGNSFGTVIDDYTATIIPNMNNSFAVIGTSSGSFGVTDLWVLNLDSLRTNIPLLDNQLDTNSIQETSNEILNAKVYPNPFNDILTIESDKTIKQISIVDCAGRLVMSVNNSSKIDMSRIHSGSYFVTIYFLDNTFTSQGIVKIK